MSGAKQPLYLQEDTHISTKHPLFSKQWFDLHRPLVVGGFLIGGLLLVALLFNHTNQQGMGGFTTQGAGECVEKINCDEINSENECNAQNRISGIAPCAWNPAQERCSHQRSSLYPSGGCKTNDYDEDVCDDFQGCKRIGEEVFDCLDLSKNIGDSCNDGNIDTDNDVVLDSCVCIGECINPPRYYLDADGDGYGGSEIYLDTCYPPSGYVLARDEVPRWDCDDSDPAVRRDCDNTVVCEGSTPCEMNGECLPETLYYEDTDQDGYGDPMSTTLSCETVPGFVSDNTDCDDRNNATYPAAIEICDDNIDNDCDGDIDQNDNDCTTTNVTCSDTCSNNGPKPIHASRDSPTENTCGECARRCNPGYSGSNCTLDQTIPNCRNDRECENVCSGNTLYQGICQNGECVVSSIGVECPDGGVCEGNECVDKTTTCGECTILGFDQVFCDKNRVVTSCDIINTSAVGCDNIPTDRCGIYTCPAGQISNPEQTDCCEDSDNNGVCGDQSEDKGFACNASTKTCSECTIGSTPGCYNTLGDCKSNCQEDEPDVCEGECIVGTKQCGRDNNAVEECVDGGTGCNTFVTTICSEKSIQCSDGTTRTCQRTCVNASCADCVLDPCPTPPEDPPTDPCQGIVCEDSVRYCEYGGDQSCSNSCTNGQCGSCTPNQCQTAPDPTPPNPTPPTPNPTPPQDPPSCDDTTWAPSTDTIPCGKGLTQTSNCGNTREVSGTKDCVAYARELGSYGNCSETCGGGTRTASYICKSNSGLEVADSFCEKIESKPDDIIEICNEQKCIVCENGARQDCGEKEYDEGGVRCKQTAFQICKNNTRGLCGEEVIKKCEETQPTCIEGDTKACGNAKGECSQGAQTCTNGARSSCVGATPPSNETCDDKDNDCDGQIDEGVKNLCGTCGLVPDEICDGVDNDCDGTIDEGCGCDNGDTQSCGTDTGQCSEGSQTCTDGARGDCVGGVASVPELCDGLDNDCDGEIDENTKNACGVCGEVPDEICDDLDNDCDGEVDEGSVCLECIVGSTEVCGSDEGRCEQGLRTCTVDGRSACEGDIPPVGELCDSLDNDCDGLIDENLECHRGGGGRRGGQNFCGDGLLRLNLGEECDDGNNTDGDGCSRNCRLEGGISPVQPDEPGLTIELALRHASQKLRMACDYDDVAYDEIAFKDIERDTSGSPADILRTYCIVKGYDKTNRTLYHADASTSVAEWIKIVSKIHAMGTDQEFDEYNQYNGHLNFTDVRDTKRYASYVGYADKVGLLDGVGIKFGSLRLLKPTTPISKERAARILKNAGATKSYTLEMGSGKYLRRDAAAAIAVHAFSDTFADYRYMYGNNIELYQALLDKITGMTEADQKVFIRSFIIRLSALNSEVMGKKFNLHIVGMVLFLESILDGSYQFGNPMHGSGEHGSAGPQTPVDRIIIDDYYDLRDFLGL